MTTTTFSLTDKQREATRLMAGPQTHTMLFGGSRSGKTFNIVRAYCVRAIKYPGSRQAMLRFRFNHIRSSIVADTFPKVMKLCFPEVKWKLDKTEWKADFQNGSEIWFGGLDDKDRTEKILGQEHCGIYLNECSQIPWGSVGIARTRLAQNIGARLRMDHDCNPPNQAHWTYKLFIEKKDPVSGKPLPKPEDYAAMLLNPGDNADNLPPGYIEQLESLPERMRRRFLSGEFLPAAENALWSAEIIDRQRIVDASGPNALPDMQRVVVAVDPSGADEENPDADEIGIIVAGIGTDGKGYLLEDLTIRTSPAKWGEIATTAFDRHHADAVVAETNYGGAMVKHVIQTARPNTPFREVKASRGKAVRAEPISSLYETGKIYHVGYFPELEDEMCAFTTAGYMGDDSPNRADALVWAFTSLFPGMTKKDASDVMKNMPPPPPVRPSHTSWMG